MTRTAKAFILATLAILPMLGVSGPAAALDSSCRAVGDAFKKSYGLPYHQFVTQTENGKPDRSELIYDGKSIYMQIHGQWIAAGEMENPFQDIFKEAPDQKVSTCSKLREEQWDGQSAIVYQVRRHGEAKVVNEDVWLSSAGLVLRMLSDDSEHFEVRMQYTDVKAPANAKKLGS